MNMRDRLARAIHKSTYGSDVMWRESLATADAVLHELMTPTEGMLDAGVQVTVDSAAYDAADEGEVFTAMIKAAKEGK